jgi:hypothetical protein
MGETIANARKFWRAPPSDKLWKRAALVAGVGIGGTIATTVLCKGAVLAIGYEDPYNLHYPTGYEAHRDYQSHKMQQVAARAIFALTATTGLALAISPHTRFGHVSGRLVFGGGIFGTGYFVHNTLPYHGRNYLDYQQKVLNGERLVIDTSTGP